MTRSELMSRIRSVSMAETASKSYCERKVGFKLVHQPRGMFGRPDFANRSRKTVVFFHGCFFHRHHHVKAPKTNRGFWLAKFRRNQARDRRVAAWYRRRGWSVRTVWECDFKAFCTRVRPRLRSRKAVL